MRYRMWAAGLAVPVLVAAGFSWGWRARPIPDPPVLDLKFADEPDEFPPPTDQPSTGRAAAMTVSRGGLRGRPAQEAVAAFGPPSGMTEFAPADASSRQAAVREHYRDRADRETARVIELVWKFSGLTVVAWLHPVGARWVVLDAEERRTQGGLGIIGGETVRGAVTRPLPPG